MKKLLVTVFLLATSATFALAQNSKINAAERALQDKKYDEAKTDIEAALQNEKTKDSPKAWYVNAEIHGAIASQNKDPKEAMLAFEYYKKALEAESKYLVTSYKDLSNLYVVVGNSGYADLNTQKFDSAYLKFINAFEIVNYINDKGVGKIPTDTAMVFYTGYAADQSDHKDSAFAYFKKAAELNFKGEPFLYTELAKMYEQRGDSANWLASLETGKKMFPTNNNFALMEIDYYQKTGKTDVLLNKLEDEVAKDPNSYPMALNLAVTYDNMANPHDAHGNDLPRPANADSLEQKAVEYYKKAIAIMPDDYRANFNLALLYYNDAVKFGKQANSLGSSQTEQHKADSLATIQHQYLDNAFPFLEKTYQVLDAKDKLNANEIIAYKSTLTGLKELYARKNDMDKVNEMKTKLENADSKAGGQ